MNSKCEGVGSTNAVLLKVSDPLCATFKQTKEAMAIQRIEDSVICRGTSFAQVSVRG